MRFLSCPLLSWLWIIIRAGNTCMMWYRKCMMTSWHEYTFHITGPLLGESSGHWWIIVCKVHDDVMTWKYFPHYWTFVRGILLSLVDCAMGSTWWWHDLEMLSTLLALCAGNPSVTSGFLQQRASYAELWCLLCFKHKHVVENTANMPVIWAVVTFMWHNCNDIL